MEDPLEMLEKEADVDGLELKEKYDVDGDPKSRTPTYHSDKDSHYVLPNDSPERRRLAAQAFYAAQLMDNRVHHAPIQGSSTVLDIGCGTGVVTDALGRSLPHAMCYGLDLSAAPAARPRPENVHFLSGNIMTRRPSEWTDQAGKHPFGLSQDEGLFDYTFSRLLILGITDWPHYIRTQFALLKPGGWAEIHDLDTATYFDDAKNIVSDAWEWHRTVTRVSEQRGMDFRCGTRAKGWMADAGFTDIEVFSYQWPFGASAQPPGKTRVFAQFNDTSFPDLLHHMISRVMAGTSQDQIEAAQAEIRRSFSPDEKKWLPFTVTVGRKPLGTA